MPLTGYDFCICFWAVNKSRQKQWSSGFLDLHHNFPPLKDAAYNSEQEDVDSSLHRKQRVWLSLSFPFANPGLCTNRQFFLSAHTGWTTSTVRNDSK